VAVIFGDFTALSRVVHALVGVAAIMVIARLPVLAKLRTA